MKKEYGYSQMLFNYITDYAQGINETAIQMEFVWRNRDKFKEDVDVKKAMEVFKEDIEGSVKYFLSYLEPLEED